MRVPAIAAITGVRLKPDSTAVIAAPSATQVEGQRLGPATFKVAPTKLSNPSSTNPLSAFSMILYTSGGAGPDR